jgi:hypothetical protein
MNPTATDITRRLPAIIVPPYPRRALSKFSSLEVHGRTAGDGRGRRSREQTDAAIDMARCYRVAPHQNSNSSTFEPCAVNKSRPVGARR